LVLVHEMLGVKKQWNVELQGYTAAITGKVSAVVLVEQSYLDQVLSLLHSSHVL